MISLGHMLIDNGLLAAFWGRCAFALPPSVVATPSDPDNMAHTLNTERLTMTVDKGVLHFRLFAKYTAAFFVMASSSFASASWRFKRAFSSANDRSRSDVSCCSCALDRH